MKQDGKYSRSLEFRLPIICLCSLAVFIFSMNGLASECAEGSYSTSTSKAYINAAPDDPVRNYIEGYSIYCQGRKEEGLSYIEKASDLGHVTASYFLGDYYRRDKSFSSSVALTNIQENYDAAIFYYQRAVTQIENTTSYPRRPDGWKYEAEESDYMSIRVFLHLHRLYYNGYGRALGDMLKNDVSYIDTIKVLENLKSAAERCLRRPSLSAWSFRQSEIARSKQVICQARKDFSERALELEFQRIDAAKHCETSLSECQAHKVIIDQIRQAAKEMVKKMKSVPAI